VDDIFVSEEAKMEARQRWAIVISLIALIVSIWLTTWVWQWWPWQFRSDINDLRQRVEQLEGVS